MVQTDLLRELNLTSKPITEVITTSAAENDLYEDRRRFQDEYYQKHIRPYEDLLN